MTDQAGNFSHCVAGSIQNDRNASYTFPSSDNTDLQSSICKPFYEKSKDQKPWNFYGRMKYGTYLGDIKVQEYCPYREDVSFCGPMIDFSTLSVKVY